MGKLKLFIRELVPELAKILFGALVIGLCFHHHLLLGGALLLYMGVRLFRERQTEDLSKWRLGILGMFVSFLVGVVTEFYGTSHGYWTYYGQPADWWVPFWVPLAWAQAYRILYRVEKITLNHFELGGVGFFAMLVFISSVLPVYGEVIAMSFGVWEYHWQPQWWGMPPQAASLLCISHIAIYFLIRPVYRHFGVSDPIYYHKRAWIASKRLLRV